MERGNEVIYLGIGLIGMLFSAGYYFDLVTERIAFPIIFFTLGSSQLYNAIFLLSNDRILERIMSFFLAGLMLFFWWIITSMYYF